MSEHKTEAKETQADLVELKLTGGRDTVDLTLAAKLVEPILKAVEEKKVACACRMGRDVFAQQSRCGASDRAQDRHLEQELQGRGCSHHC